MSTNGGCGNVHWTHMYVSIRNTCEHPIQENCPCLKWEGMSDEGFS